MVRATTSFARTLLALAVIPLGLAVGLAVGIAQRERRAAWNAALGFWGRWGPWAAGIRLEVRGVEHLERARPCVFVINHPSGIDPLLVCALLRRDFVGVAKQEIRRNPVLGPAFGFVGTVFIDRGDTAAAVAALRPAVATLRSGVSIAVAPEGTRSAGGVIGRFKKGAFRIALAARVPLVPIVLCNSGAALPRGAWLMRPATVRVEVHPPIDTTRWRPEELDREIEAVEQLYRATLQPGSPHPSL